VHCKASNEVRDTAIPLVRILNALMAVHNQTKTVEFSIVVEQQSDGNFKRHFYMKAEAGEYRIRGSAVGLSIGGAARQPKKTFVQDALGLASGNLLEALEHFSRADNWHDLYKAFEAITAHWGGRPAIQAHGFSRRDIDDFAMSAQPARHHKATSTPSHILSLAEGQQFVRKLLRACF
jgi:hypothetical protein